MLFPLKWSYQFLAILVASVDSVKPQSSDQQKTFLKTEKFLLKQGNYPEFKDDSESPEEVFQNAFLFSP